MVSTRGFVGWRIKPAALGADVVAANSLQATVGLALCDGASAKGGFSAPAVIDDVPDAMTQ